jgi:hypothetical protein
MVETNRIQVEPDVRDRLEEDLALIRRGADSVRDFQCLLGGLVANPDEAAIVRQFEREVTSERIRDKMAASRARGLWMGGHVPLG